ncbi:MAG: ion transporter [Pseudomonadota bacterium]
MNSFATFRQSLDQWIESPLIRFSILGIILFNAIILGLETSKPLMESYGPLIITLDRICLWIFVAELAIKIFAKDFRFLKDAWNIFDFILVAIAFVPNSGGLTVLRALRILRVLRVVSIIPSLRRVVEGFFRALPGMGSIFILMGMIFYIGSVMATKLFGTAFEEWFGTMGRSAYSLFQIMTLESWSMGIVRPVMEVYPLAWLFFVPFILITAFAFMNLLVGLIVNSMQDAHSEELNAATDTYREDVLRKLSDLSDKIDRIETQAKSGSKK